MSGFVVSKKEISKLGVQEVLSRAQKLGTADRAGFLFAVRERDTRRAITSMIIFAVTLFTSLIVASLTNNGFVVFVSLVAFVYMLNTLGVPGSGWYAKSKSLYLADMEVPLSNGLSVRFSHELAGDYVANVAGYFPPEGLKEKLAECLEELDVVIAEQGLMVASWDAEGVKILTDTAQVYARINQARIEANPNWAYYSVRN